MDNNINLNKTYETDCRSPLKELYIKNNAPEEKCDNRNKETHLFDMESTFLENSVLIPAELNQNSELNESCSSNQENLTPKYSVLNSFDTIIKKEGEEVISRRHNNELLSDSVLDYSISRNVELLNADQPFPNKIIPEDFVEKTTEISVSVTDNLSLCTSELNGTSASNISTQSDNSVLNNTVILNKSLIVENKTPGQVTVDDNSNLSLTSTDNSELNKEQENFEHVLNEISNDSLNLSSKIKSNIPDFVHLNNEQNLIPAEETPEIDQNNSNNLIVNSNDSLNLLSTLKPNNSVVIDSNKEQNLSSPQKTEVQEENNSDHILYENDDDLLNELSSLQENNSAVIYSNKEQHLRPADEILVTDQINFSDSIIEEQTTISSNSLQENNSAVIYSNKEQHLRPADEILVTDHTLKINFSDSIIEEQTTISSKIESFPSLQSANDSLIEAFSNKLVLSPKVEKSAENTSINEQKSEIHNKKEITSNFGIKCESELKLPIISNEVNLDESVKSLKIVGEEEKQIDISSDISSVDPNVTISLEQKVYAEINKNISSAGRNTSFEISKEENNKKCLDNQIESYEVTNTSAQITEIEQQKDSNGTLSTEKSHSVELLGSTCETISIISELKESASSVLVPEGTHMSSIEPNLGLSEQTVETSAPCTTNEMGEIINQNECFEKVSDIPSSAVDNNAEREKYKMQINELKKELKSCRQKTCTLETEIVDFKRKENELNMLLEEYKQSSASTEQLKRLQASEEALKNEIKELRTLLNQQETYLKDLQQKDTKEQNEQLKRLQVNEEVLKNEIKELKALVKQHDTNSQSEIQISRVMEEYEKSISSLISENEKMKKERDTAQMHLANIEMAFSDVHQKYERCKAIVQGYKDNEESFKQDIAMNRETIVIQEQKYETLKAHAMAQLEKSNQELAAMKKQHETEMARLTAQLKRYEIKNMSLMESLQQKAKECEQLSAVCDEFIGNV